MFGSEETVKEMRDRYLEFNAHGESYTWKVLVPGSDGAPAEFKPLDMDRTLEDNGFPLEEEEIEDLGLDTEEYLPVIHLYYNDDLTEG